MSVDEWITKNESAVAAQLTELAREAGFVSSSGKVVVTLGFVEPSRGTIHQPPRKLLVWRPASNARYRLLGPAVLTKDEFDERTSHLRRCEQAVLRELIFTHGNEPTSFEDIRNALISDHEVVNSTWWGVKDYINDVFREYDIGMRLGGVDGRIQLWLVI